MAGVVVTVTGPPQSGKSAIAREIYECLNNLGFATTIEDADFLAVESGRFLLMVKRLAALREKGLTIVVRTLTLRKEAA